MNIMRCRLFSIFLTSVLLCGPAAAEMPEIHTIVHTGTLRDSCGPTDGAAFIIALDGNIDVHVYASFKGSTSKGGGTTFHADQYKQNYNGGASISACNKNRTRCFPKSGMVSITTVEGDIVTGTVQYLPAAWGRGSSFTENHTFRVKYVPNKEPLLCG